MAYKIVLRRGTAYYDPKTKIHLTRRKPSFYCDDEFLENHDMSSIESAIGDKVLKKLGGEDLKIEEKKEETSSLEEISQKSLENKEEEIIEEEVIEEKEEVIEKEVIEEDNGLEALQEDGDPRCQAITGSKVQCDNTAKYPEDNPIYCGIHKSKLEE